MSSVTLIFPHQLFAQHPALQKNTPVILVEEFLFFKHYNFHKQKLVLHRASMKCYEETLQKKGYKVEYVETFEKESDVRILMKTLRKKGITEIVYADTVDDWLERRLKRSAKKEQVQLHQKPSPNFLNSMSGVDDFFHKKKTYFQTDFYTWQRKQRNLLVDAQQKPMGGKWTFDAENRLKFPQKEKVPSISFPKENKFAVEAKAYVEKHFSNNYGNSDSFIYPVTHKEAEQWLHEFMQTRFEKFGIYEDAMVAKESFLYHSVLTPMLNIGLLNPQQIIDAALQTASQQNIPLNSLEGFIRQIIGWREFIRIVYEREGRKQRTHNYWGFKRKIPESFWKGTTGIEPVDTVIKKVLTTGYSHHIERLMVLGNFMLLCEFDPDEVYRWFMELYVDSYDWVMVPNVYGMTQFADGGLMTTKPYISGSNYLMKMGDWKKGEWQQVWDGLFWRFMHVHRTFFGSNPRLGMLLNTFDRMPAEKQKMHLQHAEAFLRKLDDK
ncbi:MAG: cryptochrome/photolyase family protein [Chitinophagaceae bacterium]|nr:cryptochrome/photolyase family protein [Chitinophagaceae bacterium]